MSSPTERPVPDDSAPDQDAAAIAKSQVPEGAGHAAAGTERSGMFGVQGTGDTSGFGGLVHEPWVPPAAAPPYGGYFDELMANLATVYPALPTAVSRVVVDRGELTLHVLREHLVGVATALRNDPSLRFEMCTSVSGVDYLGAVNRLHAVYHFTSMTFRRRLRVEVEMSVDDPHVPSLTALYPGVDWQERETYDMFGIVFDGHPALTRILMPDDWDGFPQRKDYPLGGIPVQYKGATIPPPDERRAYR